LEETVVVLGAGASAPYGFPSGQKLMNDISRGIRAKNRLFEDLVLCGWAPAQLMQFADELSHEDRYSLDAFLETHPDFLKLGKEAIAQALIPCEADSNIAARREDGWY